MLCCASLGCRVSGECIHTPRSFLWPPGDTALVWLVKYVIPFNILLPIEVEPLRYIPQAQQIVYVATRAGS